MELQWFDYAIIGLIGVSMLISIIRGFIREALSLASWILAFWVSFTFSEELAGHLSSYIQSSTLQIIAAMVILFISTLLVSSLVSHIISKLFQKTGLSGTDRLLGMLFGAARGALLVAVILMMANMAQFSKHEAFESSTLAVHFQPMAHWLAGFMPKDIDLQKLISKKAATPAKKADEPAGVQIEQ